MIQAAARAGTDAALYAAAIARWDNEGGALGASDIHATQESHKGVKFERTGPGARVAADSHLLSVYLGARLDEAVHESRALRGRLSGRNV
jgi:hypothetical protein